MSSSLAILNDFKICGLPDTWQKADKDRPVYFSMLQAIPKGNRPPIKKVCSAWGDTIEQMKRLKIRNGSRINCIAEEETYSKNDRVYYSYKVSNITLMPLECLPESSNKKPTEQQPVDNDIEVDLDLL